MTDRATAPTAVGYSSDFAEWVSPHLSSMRRLAMVRAPSADPDDLVQESLVRAWQKRASFQPERGSTRSWLLAITADQARRHRIRSPRLHLLPAVDPAWAPPDLAADLDLRRAIAVLSSRQRQAVLLFYYVDLSVDEAAAVMGCSAGTVKSTLADARSKLAKILEVSDD